MGHPVGHTDRGSQPQGSIPPTLLSLVFQVFTEGWEEGDAVMPAVAGGRRPHSGPCLH